MSDCEHKWEWGSEGNRRWRRCWVCNAVEDIADIIAERDAGRIRIRELETHIADEHRREHSLRMFGAREVLERAETRIRDLEAALRRFVTMHTYCCLRYHVTGKEHSEDCPREQSRALLDAGLPTRASLHGSDTAFTGDASTAEHVAEMRGREEKP